MILKRILSYLRPVAPVLDVLFFGITFIGILWFRIIKFWGPKNTPLSKWLFFKLGMIPVVNHYYEPFPNLKDIKDNNHPRVLPGLKFNIHSQLDLLKKFNFRDELSLIPFDKREGYYYDNQSFGIGDGEAYYSLIRYLKPKKIIEIGGGFSTMLAELALKKNLVENPDHDCVQYCIEPFEFDNLEQLNIKLIKSKAESISKDFYLGLERNDILFIDSSHIIKPDEDVLFEILEILPILNLGVFVHFHDIFTPYNYPKKWVTEELRLWNEQFMLEGFLSHNDHFDIKLSMAYLNSIHPEKLITCFPNLDYSSKSIPSSFWIQKR